MDMTPVPVSPVPAPAPRNFMFNKAHTRPIWIVGGLLYISLVVVFAIQTLGLVNFLYPDDQLWMKVFTLVSFDVMNFFWSICELWYGFSSRSARLVCQFAWWITLGLSLAASVLYLVIESMFRFHVSVSQDLVNIGYTITIAALVYNILSFLGFIKFEYEARNPRLETYLDDRSQPEPLYPRVQHEWSPAPGSYPHNVTPITQPLASLPAPEAPKTQPLPEDKRRLFEYLVNCMASGSMAVIPVSDIHLLTDVPEVEIQREMSNRGLLPVPAAMSEEDIAKKKLSRRTRQKAPQEGG